MENRANNRMSDSEHVVEQISSYLDGALDDTMGDYVRAHIESCVECRAEYVEVRVTRQLLRSVSAVSPPRAFTLTQEMVARRVWLWHRLLVPRNAPRLATGSVLTFGLVALLLLGNLGGLFSPAAQSNVAALSVQKFVEAPSQLTPEEQYNFSTPPDQRSMAPLPGTPAAAPAVPEAAATSVTALDMASPSTATPDTEASGDGYNTETPSLAEGGASRTEQATAVPTQEALPPGGGFNGSQLPDPVSQPQSVSAQPSSDGGQVLVFALMSLLVALGGAFAVGAVVAARR